MSFRSSSCSTRRVEKASASEHGERWTHYELYAYLDAKHVVASMIIREPGDDWNRPAEWLIRDDSGAELRVTRLKSTEAARMAAASGTKSGEFAWGRFHFRGNSAMLARIRAHLYE